MKIDIYRANAHEFQIIDGKLMPSLSTIDGLGDKAADAFVTAAAEGSFLSRDDLEMFRLLLNVNGIGPKAALGVLAGLTADELRFAVLSDDIKTISRAPGIGKKTAQKLILELKDKLKLEDAFEKKLAHEQEATNLSGSVLHDGRQEAVEALVALGYSSTEAMKAVRKVTDVSPDDVEGLLKAALKLF